MSRPLWDRTDYREVEGSCCRIRQVVQAALVTAGTVPDDLGCYSRKETVFGYHPLGTRRAGANASHDHPRVVSDASSPDLTCRPDIHQTSL